MALDNVLKIYDEQGNPVDYDILASDVKFQDGKDLPTKLGELEEEIGEGGYTPPQGGIPKTDLAPAVQTSLDKADSAYQKPQTGIPATDIADGVIPDVSGFATKTEVDDAIDDALDGFTPADIPTKVSDLTNDAGYQTQQQVAAAISQAAIEAVVGSGDFVMTYDEATETYNIVRLVPTITVSDESLAFDSTSKVKTITISGTNLKADIAITAPSGWTASVNSLAQVDGVVAETQVTLTYGGADASTASGDLVLTAGTATVSVPLSYTQYGGPTITVDPATLTFAAIGGQSETKTATVGKFNIDGEVSVAVSGTDAGKFSASLSGSTLSVTYTPGNINSGNHQATITLSASGAQSKTVAVNGTVLEQSLTITSNPSPLSLQSDNNVAATGTINVKGQNITGNVSLSVSGSGFTLSENSLAAADVNSANGVDVTVTATIASGDTASATISASSGLASASITAEWNKTETDPAVDDIKVRNGLHYIITGLPSGSTNGTAMLVNTGDADAYTSNTPYQISGGVVIPASITINNKLYDVTKVASYALFNADGITSVTFANGSQVDEIKTQAFAGMDNLESIQLPDSLTSIGSSILRLNTKVKRLVIPANVTNLQNGSFSDSGLEYVDCLGVTGMGFAFYEMSSIKTVILRYTGGVVAGHTNNFNMQSTSSPATVYVPDALVSSYETADIWSTQFNDGKIIFKSINELPNN